MNHRLALPSSSIGSAAARAGLRAAFVRRAAMLREKAPEDAGGPRLKLLLGEAEAFAAVNDSEYGLQAGVFTHDLQTAFRAHRALEVGGVVIGDVPSYRADQMPYGGVKQSGVGREGVRFAMDDYTYERVLVLTGLAL